MNHPRLSPVELEVELFCLGLRVDQPSRDSLDARRITRTRAGLGSGLEIVLPGGRKDVWVNAPVEEKFVDSSPYSLVPQNGGYCICDDRNGLHYDVTIPREPAWYGRRTSRGTEMSRVGVLQGTYLGIFLSNTCLYWYTKPGAQNCQFCTSGQNVGVNEIARKHLDDVVEVARAAKDESGSVFTHFNTGYQYEENPRRRGVHGLTQAKPYVAAVRSRVGGFIGVQSVPVTRECYDEYDELIGAGADHFSFCVELLDKELFARYCPGKAATVGQDAFFDAMAYTAGKLGKGRVSGEIIAGLEPVASTLRAIDRIVETGAFPTVCIFRPLIGSDLEKMPPPDPEAMKDVMAYQYEACRRAGIPIGILPIEVSLVVQPEEGRELLAPHRAGFYELKMAALKRLARPYTTWKMRPHAARLDTISVETLTVPPL
ncbi:MAG: radical SAM protein [Thermoanaerobaculia bacterium]